jgi:uncharacterized protein (TIGR02444 family)
MAQAQQGGSPFWRFSLQFYRMPGVADACIALQDEAGVDVNLLLFLLWNASLGRQLSGADVEDLERRIAEWRDGVVIPLRDLRRKLKSPPALIEKGAAEAFRTRIKQVELEAERLQQEALFALSQAAPLGGPALDGQAVARNNVTAYQEILGRQFSPAAVETLLSAFGKVSYRGQ